MAGRRNSSQWAVLLLALIAAGSVSSRSLQQDQQPVADAGNPLGNLVNQVGNAAGQIANTFLQPVLNATQQATQQAANATGPNSNITAPLANLGQAINNITSNLNISNPLANITGASPAPGNTTNLGQSVGQGLNQFFGNLTTNLTQASQQFANNLTRAVETVGNGSGSATQQQQQIAPPWQSGAGGRTAAGAFAGFAAGAVVLLQLLL